MPLASVEQFPYQQGQKATDILLDLINKMPDEEEDKDAYYRLTIDSKLIVNEKFKQGFLKD